MEIVFKNPELEEIFRTGKEKGKPKYGQHIVKAFVKVVIMLKRAPNTVMLGRIGSLHFEALKRDLSGYYSVRVKISTGLFLRLKRGA